MVVEKYLLNGWNGTTDIWREVVLYTDYQALEREIERLKHPILRGDVTPEITRRPPTKRVSG